MLQTKILVPSTFFIFLYLYSDLINRANPNRLVLIALGLTVYLACYLFLIQSDIKTGANYSHFFVKGDQAFAQARIVSISPWGSQTELMRDGHGVWRVPNGEKRLISNVFVTIPGSRLPRATEFAWSLDSEPEKDWELCELRLLEGSDDQYQLLIPTHSSVLFPKYGQTVNWKGDLALILRPAFSAGYSIALVGLLIFGLILYRGSIYDCARLIANNFKPSRGEILVGIAVLGVFLFLNFRNADLPVVMYRQFDELSILRSIEALEASHLVYGVLFNAISLPFLLPGILTDNFSWSISGGRMQSALFMLFGALIFRRILALRFGGLPLTLLSFFPFLVPFFWVMGTLFHPDAQMTAYLLGCCYFLLKDEKKLGLDFYAACFFFAAAVAVKLHAVMFAPLIPFYLISVFSQKNSTAKLKPVVNAAAVFLITYLICEPRRLFLSKLERTIEGFLFQMWTNKTGFDLTSSVNVTIVDKLSTIDKLYSPLILVTLLVLTATLILFHQLRSKRNTLAFLFATNFIVISYYLFFLNKDWSYYYISPFFLFLVFAFTQLGILFVKPQIGKSIAIVIIAIQLVMPWDSWKLVFADYYMPDRKTRKELNQTNDSLLKLFAATGTNVNFLISYGIPFDYHSLNVDESRIRYLTTGKFRAIQQSDFLFLKELKSDYIVLNRSHTKTNHTLVSKFRESLPSLGYGQVFQDEVVDVFRLMEQDNSKARYP